MTAKFKNSYFSYFLIYNFYYAAWALLGTLLSVYLLDKGFKASSVAFVVSSGYLSSMVCQPFIGTLHDKTGIKKVNTVLLALGIVFSIGFVLSKTLPFIALFYSLLLVCLNGVSPVMDKVAAECPFPYGRVRIWGTIGYAAATQVTGILYERVSPSSIYVCLSVSLGLALAGLLGITISKGPDPDKVYIEEKKKASKGGVLSNRTFVYYTVIACIYYGMITVAETYIPALFISKGLSAETTSTILSIAVLCEAPLVLFSGAFMDKIPSKVLLISVLCAFSMEYAAYALSLPFAVILPITILVKHPMGMIFGMTNLKIVMSIIDNEHQITALALVATFKSLSTILCQNAAGRILDSSSYSVLFSVILGCTLTALVMAFFLKIGSGNDRKLFS